MIRAIPLLAVLALPLTPDAASAETRQTSAGPVEIVPVLDGLDVPWALEFLPGGEMLITEREGWMLHVDAAGDTRRVAGLPDIETGQQGGLLDVMVPRDFAQTREIYLTFVRAQRRGSGTALARGTLSEDGAALENVDIIWELAAGSSGGRHFGSRVVEGADGFLYVSIGDRGDRPSAQDVGNENGSIVRLARDGTIPADNPLVGQADARPGIWSWGHRNPQGMAVDGEGRLWAVEHGARGGDEINLIERGRNYGWPVISYGRHYSGARIGEGTERAGLEQPRFYWDPSIAPSGMTFVDSALYPDWAGDLLVGSLNTDFISRLEVTDGAVREVERIETSETRRVRDVQIGPDGAVWFLSEGQGALFRMTPAGEG